MRWIYMWVAGNMVFILLMCLQHILCLEGVLFIAIDVNWIEKVSKMQSIIQIITQPHAISKFEVQSCLFPYIENWQWLLPICRLTSHCLQWWSYKQDLNVHKCECEPRAARTNTISVILNPLNFNIADFNVHKYEWDLRAARTKMSPFCVSWKN